MRYILAYVTVETQIARLELLSYAQHILKHQHLSVDAAAGTDAYDRYLDFGGDARSEGCGYLFKHHREASRLFKHVGVVDYPVGLIFFGGADCVGSELVDALRCQSQVP